jgi:peptide deformylase
MAILPIVTYNDPFLRKKTKPVSNFNDDLSSFIANLFETMYNSEGVGLAAPQVGSSKSVFVIDVDNMVEDEQEESFGPLAFINPEIIEMGKTKIPMDEGCLSIPEVNDKVLRPERIVITYTDQSFTERTQEFTGWNSRVIQHEYDHLKGILFIDYLSAFRKRMHKSALEEIDKGLRATTYPLKPKV